METKAKRLVEKRYRDLVFEKIILYKNPRFYRSWYLERVNPDHVAFLWAKRRKKGKGDNMVKIAKVYFHVLPVVFGLSVVGWLDAMTGYVFGLLVSVGFWGCLLGGVVSLVLYFPLLLDFRRVVFG